MQLPISVRPVEPIPPPAARALTRAATAHLLREIRDPYGASVDDILAQTWPRDLHAKAASSPITTSAASALQATAIASFVAGLQPQSAAARLMANGIQVDLEGTAVSVPRASTNPLPAFVDEGAPIPVAQAVLGAATVGPAKKMALIEALTAELADMSVESAELVVRTIMTEAAAKALDAAVFSTAAANSSRPAGILNGVTGLTATAGGGVAAVLGDIGALVAALTTAGGGTRVLLFMPPAKAAVLMVYAPAGVGFEVVPCPALAPSTVVALDPQAFASGFGPGVQIHVSASTLLHFEDTTPLHFSNAGTLATPARAMFQANSYAVRLILRCAWCVRAPGLVQFVSNVTW